MTDLYTYRAVITLNVNGLNILIKRQKTLIWSKNKTQIQATYIRQTLVRTQES